LRFATPTFDQTLNNGRGGYRCGHCDSADDWVDTPTHTGCANCDTFVTEEFAVLMDELNL
jgi:hypothetical protein